MAFYKHDNDKKSGDGLAITEWNTLSSAIAGNSGLHFALNPADQVGIGTSNPGVKLDVNGNLHLSSTDASLHFTKNKVKQFITFGTWGSNAYGIGVQAFTQYFRTNTDFAWFQNGLHSDERFNPGTGGIALMVLSNGKLGIGTTKPDEKLEVDGNVKAIKFIGDGSGLSNLNLGSTGTYSGKTPTLYFNDANKGIFYSAKARGTGYNSWTSSGPNDGPVLFGFSDVALGTRQGGNKVTLYGNSAGNIGIGTTSPTAQLHIKNPGDVNLILEADSNNVGENDHPIIHFKQDNKQVTAEVGYFGGTNSFRVRNHYGGAYLVFADNGNVGIGTTQPTQKLQVNGHIAMAGSGNFFETYVSSKQLHFKLKSTTHGSNKHIFWDGDSNWDSVSDRRLKTHIENESNILKRLLELDVKNYNWKDSPTSKRPKSIGFIAQDVQPLFPALVGEMEDPDSEETTFTLKYANFGVLAVGAIKELKQEYDKKINTLEQELAELKKKFNA